MEQECLKSVSERRQRDVRCTQFSRKTVFSDVLCMACILSADMPPLGHLACSGDEESFTDYLLELWTDSGSEFYNRYVGPVTAFIQETPQD